VASPNVVVRLDNTALDFQFRLQGERSPGQEVMLVLVDEKSLKRLDDGPGLAINKRFLSIKFAQANRL
jgi:hypothetical protein